MSIVHLVKYYSHHVCVHVIYEIGVEDWKVVKTELLSTWSWCVSAEDENQVFPWLPGMWVRGLGGEKTEPSLQSYSLS